MRMSTVVGHRSMLMARSMLMLGCGFPVLVSVLTQLAGRDLVNGGFYGRFVVDARIGDECARRLHGKGREAYEL